MAAEYRYYKLFSTAGYRHLGNRLGSHKACAIIVNYRTDANSIISPGLIIEFASVLDGLIIGFLMYNWQSEITGTGNRSQAFQSTYRKTSIKRRVPNNRRVSNKRRGFEESVLINAGSRLNAGSQINARVFQK